MHIKNTIELYDAYENVTAYMIDYSNNMGYISFNVLSGDVLDASSFNFMSDEFTQSMRGTAPNVPITRPEDYESGYSSITSKNVSNYNQTYQKKLTLWVLIIVEQQL